jgi:Domain of unknown function (DUF4915)
LENSLRPKEVISEQWDRLFVPRNVQMTGPCNLHELCVEPSGRIIFANTRYACLATISMTYAFKPLWKPPFISKNYAGGSMSP